MIDETQDDSRAAITLYTDGQGRWLKREWCVASKPLNSRTK
jgi:hypothetical protein